MVRFVVRYVISLFCVMLSVWSVTALMSLTHGAYRESMEIIDRMGADRFQVYPLVSSIEDIPDSAFGLEDTAEVERTVDNVRTARPATSGQKTIRHQGEELIAMVTATADNAPQAEHAASREWRVEQGAFLDGLDSSNAAQVAVIGRPVRDHLFGPGTNAVGERIAINGVPFFV